MQILQHQDARLYSTFRLPATLHQVLLCRSVDDLYEFEWPQRPILLGEGSNSIFLSDIHRPVLRFMADAISEQQLDNSVFLHVEAGHNWHALVTYAVQKGWWGIENLALIPGSVGAAPVQNIGAYGVEFTDCCVYVDFFHWQTRQIQRLSNEECLFGYRDSIFKHALEGQGVIVAVGLKLQLNGSAKLSYRGLDHLPADCHVDDVYQAVLDVRRSKLPDPQVLSNCGSFFKNPVLNVDEFTHLKRLHPDLPCYPQQNGQVKTAAAWLIEQSGFKGQRFGDIGCYEKQPLVLVNFGHGTSTQLITWMAQIIDTVQHRFGIRLEPEVRMLNEL